MIISKFVKMEMNLCPIKYRTNFIDFLTNYRSFGKEQQHEFSHFSLKSYFVIQICDGTLREIQLRRSSGGRTLFRDV